MQWAWNSDYWGLATAVDLYGCKPELITDARHIKATVAGLVRLLGMKAFGECQCVHFGSAPEIAGFSVTQLIETSLISGHFANQTNAAYLDVFSCAEYDPYKAAAYLRDAFGAAGASTAITPRYKRMPTI